MRQQSRYQIGNLLSEEAGVKIYKGLDPLTGLPVRCYEFSGNAIDDAELLSSPHIPDILASYAQDNQAWVFTSDLDNCKIVESYIAVRQTEAFLLDTAQALSDAALLNIVHGGICPKRFLSDGVQFYIEGYGVRWGKTINSYYPNEQSLKDDIYAWAISIKEIVGNTFPKPVESVINLCLAETSNVRPSAQALLEKLSSAYFYLSNDPNFDDSFAQENKKSSLKEKKNSDLSFKTKPPLIPNFYEDDSKKQENSKDITDSTPQSYNGNNVNTASTAISSKEKEAEDIEGNSLLLEAEDLTKAPPSSTKILKSKSAAESESSKELIRKGQDSKEASSESLSSLSENRMTVDSKKSWIEALLEEKQHEAKSIRALSANIKTQKVDEIDFEEDSSGNLQMTAISGIYETKEESKGKGNIPLSIALLIIGVLAATAITLYFFFSEEQNSLPLPISVSPTPGVRYIIYPEFPADLRLVELIVISSPEGSSYTSGSILGTLTSSGQPIFLDKEGKWQLQARFDEHLSNIVATTVPLNSFQTGLVFEFQ